MDADAAAELLVNARAEDTAGSQNPVPPVERSTESNQPEPPAPPSGDDGATAEPDSFTNIDPNTLPPEALALYRQMQADYTKKTQAIAEQRKALDGLDPVEARGALEFVQALNSDATFAQQVHQELTNALVNAGLTPAQASAEAARQVNEAATGEDTNWQDEGSQIPQELLDRLDRTEKFMQTYEQQQAEAQINARLDAQESQIRQMYPEWDAQDLEAAYAYAFANGGDLMKGAERYVAEQARIVSRLTQQKQSVPTGQPRQGGLAYTPPEPPKSLSDATSAAIEMWKAQIG